MLRNALAAAAICLALSEAVAGDPAQDEINKNLVRILENQQKMIGDQGKQVAEHGKRLTDQDKRLDDHANKSREQDRQLAELREWMNRSDQRMNDLERRQPFESPGARRPSNSTSGDEPPEPRRSARPATAYCSPSRSALLIFEDEDDGVRRRSATYPFDGKGTVHRVRYIYYPYANDHSYGYFGPLEAYDPKVMDRVRRDILVVDGR